jgi:hypothetical protein
VSAATVGIKQMYELTGDGDDALVALMNVCYHR